MKYRFSAKADRDIESIWYYTFENWSLEQADNYYKQIIVEIEHLAASPESGRNFSHFGKRYKFARVNSHIVFYQAISPNEIEVVRILHKSMDIANRLLD